MLSNNDGCVIARSDEAKALDIKMGVPVYRIKELLELYYVKVLSSNYALYGDMSHRVMHTLADFTPEVEVYSIDEAFLQLSSEDVARAGCGSFAELGARIKERVRRVTGIPVSIGIAETKTLAKIANQLAKRQRNQATTSTPGASARASGVFDLTTLTPQERDFTLAHFKVGDVWGIGRSYARMLKRHRILTARDFAQADARWVRQRMTVVGGRLHRELNGVSCLEIETCPPPRKSVTCSRSFGQSIETLDELKQAVGQFTARAGEKLRRDSLAASVVTVFIHTNRFRQDERQYANAATHELAYPSCATSELLQATLRATEAVFRAGYRYKKAGVMLSGLVPTAPLTERMYDAEEGERHKRLSEAVDEINKRFGTRIIRFGAHHPCGQAAAKWHTRAEMKSPCYTTRLEEVLTIGDGDKPKIH